VAKRLGNPLHQQVFLVLRDRILSRRYAEGEMLPSEEELRKKFQVSRTTIRNALATLNSLGLIEKRQGVGTFVHRLGTVTPLHTPMSDLITHIREITRATAVKVVEFDYVRAPRHVQDMFKSGDDDMFQRVVRVRLLKRKPIIHVTSYVPEAIGQRFGPADLEQKSLYLLLQDAGFRLCSGEQRVTATLAEPTVASRLDIDVGSPLLQIDRIHFSKDRVPVEHLEILAVPMFFELRMTLEEADMA
jgi:GntR family transcriptional regulator